MKFFTNTLLLLLTLTFSASAFSFDNVGNVHGKVAIKADSIEVVDSKTILDGYHNLTLEMTILPRIQCEENFAGLFYFKERNSRSDANYIAMFQKEDGCNNRTVGTPKTVSVEILTSVRAGHFIILNDVEYSFTGYGNDVQIRKR